MRPGAYKGPLPSPFISCVTWVKSLCTSEMVKSPSALVWTISYGAEQYTEHFLWLLILIFQSWRPRAVLDFTRIFQLGGSWEKLQLGWLQDNESSLPLSPTPCFLHFIICWPSDNQRTSCRWSFQYPWPGFVPLLLYNLSQVTDWPIRVSLPSTV